MPVTADQLARAISQPPLEKYYKKARVTASTLAKQGAAELKYLEDGELTPAAMRIRQEARKDITKQLDLYPAEKRDIKHEISGNLADLMRQHLAERDCKNKKT